MKHIISFSGGLGSFFAAMRVIKSHGADQCILLFTDTKSEDDDLYRFLNDASDYLGVGVTTIADGRNLWQVFRDVRYMGNSRVDPCSRVLKRELARKWMVENFDANDAILYMGIGWDEAHRMKNIIQNWSPYTVMAPLTEPPYLSRPQMMEKLKDCGINPPRLYDLGFSHNNCGGFCVKAGQGQFRKLLQQFPERYAYHETEQEKLFKEIKPHGFLRVSVNKKTKYLTLKEFRKHVEQGEQIDMFDLGGCGCFV